MRVYRFENGRVTRFSGTRVAFPSGSSDEDLIIVCYSFSTSHVAADIFTIALHVFLIISLY